MLTLTKDMFKKYAKSYSKNEPKAIQKLSKTIQEQSKNYPKTIQKLSINYTIQKLSKNYPKTI